jgi:hypothetical protein
MELIVVCGDDFWFVSARFVHWNFGKHGFVVQFWVGMVAEEVVDLQEAAGLDG